MTKPLRLTLRVEEDDELRTYIKELVQGQVKAIARSEFTEFLHEMIHDKVEKTVGAIDFNKQLHTLISDEFIRATGKTIGNSKYDIRQKIQEEVNLQIRQRINTAMEGMPSIQFKV